MIVRIKAKSAESSPRILTINQKPIYIVDRQDGFRLTIFSRDTFKVMGDANFSTFSEAYNNFMKYYNIPGYIGVINGHGKGNVLVAIIDANTQNKLIKRGDKEVYAEYVVSIRAPGDITEAVKESVEKTGSPEIIEKHEERQLFKNLLYSILPLAIGGIILFKVFKK